MSVARLVAKLTKSGYTEDEVETVDRTVLLEAWVKIVVVGKDQPKEVVQSRPDMVPYAAELEKKRLEFQIMNHENDTELKPQELVTFKEEKEIRRQ